MLFHIIHILILTRDPNPNPELKKKEKKNIFVHETTVGERGWFSGELKKGGGVVQYLFYCW